METYKWANECFESELFYAVCSCSFLLGREEATGSAIEFSVDKLQATVCKPRSISALDYDKLNSST